MLDRAKQAYDKACSSFFLDYLEHLSLNQSPAVEGLDDSDYLPEFTDPESCSEFFMSH